MAKTTHEKQLERARARRAAERDEHRRGIRLILALVSVLVVAAGALGVSLLMARGGDDGDDPASSDEITSELGSGDDAEDTQDASETSEPGSDEDDGDTGTTEPEGAAVEPCSPPTGDLPTPTASPYSEQPVVDLDGAATVRATLETTCGTVVVELDAAAAPATVANFVALAEDGYYEGVGFHRVMDGFMVQAGDPTGTGTGCLDDGCEQRLPGYTFEDELDLAEQVVADSGGYPRGTLAMANAGADTNGSQFFIIQGTPGYPLPAEYAVFGEVVEGMDVVDRIAQGPVDGQLAIDPVVILTVEVER